jgi:hypothetical protein
VDDLMASLSRALSTAMVLAPPGVLPALSQLTEAMNGADQRDQEWWALGRCANQLLRPLSGDGRLRRP